MVVINALLGFQQEYRAERSLAALKKMLVHEAEVRRDGQAQTLAAEQLVPGDQVVGDPTEGALAVLNRLHLQRDEKLSAARRVVQAMVIPWG